MDDLNKDETVIGKMAAELAALMRKDTNKLDKLAVVPVQFTDGVNEQDGDTLAQILSIRQKVKRDTGLRAEKKQAISFCCKHG